MNFELVSKVGLEFCVEGKEKTTHRMGTYFAKDDRDSKSASSDK